MYYDLYLLRSRFCHLHLTIKMTPKPQLTRSDLGTEAQYPFRQAAMAHDEQHKELRETINQFKVAKVFSKAKHRDSVRMKQKEHLITEATRLEKLLENYIQVLRELKETVQGTREEAARAVIQEEHKEAVKALAKVEEEKEQETTRDEDSDFVFVGKDDLEIQEDGHLEPGPEPAKKNPSSCNMQWRMTIPLIHPDFK